MPAATEEQIAKIMSKQPLTPHRMIWRDDDIGHLTNLDEFRKVDAIFKDYGFRHTIAVIVKDIEKNEALVDYINTNTHIDAQVHCWNHQELAGMDRAQLAKELSLCVWRMSEVFGKAPSVIYPPWNKTDDQLVKVAAEMGLTVKEEKLSLQQYIRVKGHVKEDTVNFHYWSYEDVLHLDAALAVYKQMGWDSEGDS